MKKLSISILLFCFTICNIFGQRSLTKDEIIQHYKLSDQKYFQQKDSINYTSNDKINTRVHYLLDSLKKIKIDSVIIYSVAYPGYFGQQNCVTGYYPISTYLIWKINNETNIQKLEGLCQFDILRLESADLFNFYDFNYGKIKDEIFMPVIYSGKINKDSTISIVESMVDHEPKYSFFYSIGNSYKYFHFTENELQEEKSLFYKYNMSLMIYKWWNLTIKQIVK